MSTPITNGHSHSIDPAEIYTKNPIYQVHRKLKVVVIGAGASGLLLAYKLQRHFDDLDLTLFEKNPEVSGTWFENVRRNTFIFLALKRQMETHILAEIPRMCM
jgi:cation diffusion facilitator CzcD-associated flavoprotein CzcO